MAWKIKAKGVECCSCEMVCRCTLGPTKPDQGWCSGALGWQVLEGQSDGVDLSGVKVVLLGDLPGDFLGGIDNARLWIDESASDDQRSHIEAIFQGQRGGPWGAMREAIKNWLPTKTAAITIQDGDSPSLTIEGVGSITLQPLKAESGKRAVLANAPIAEAFGQTELQLGLANGSKFSDPDLRAWESLGYGAESTVEWSG